MRLQTRRARKGARADIRPGDRVTIFRFDGRPMIEGRATAVKPVSSRVPNLWIVKSERRRIVRFIHGGDWQRQPTRMLRALMDLWRFGLSPEFRADFPRDDLLDHGRTENFGASRRKAKPRKRLSGKH